MQGKEAKIKATFSIDATVFRDMEKFCKSIQMSKSAYLEHLIKDSMVTTVQLFSTTESLSEAIVILSNQISEMQKLMKNSSYIEKNEKLNGIKNELQINSNLSAGV